MTALYLLAREDARPLDGMTALYCTPRNIYKPLTCKGFMDMVRRAVEVVYRISSYPRGNRKAKGLMPKHQPLVIRREPDGRQPFKARFRLSKVTRQRVRIHDSTQRAHTTCATLSGSVFPHVFLFKKRWRVARARIEPCSTTTSTFQT